MIALLLLLALAAPASEAPVQQDPAGNRIEAFAEVPGLAKEGGPAVHCTQDRAWCAEVSRDVDLNTSELHVFAGLPGAGGAIVTYRIEGEGEPPLWPQVIRSGAGVMIGLESEVTTGYSGGGGSSTTLSLIRLDPGAVTEAKAVLEVPLSGSLLIRACFSEKDMKARRGACHDEYNFGASLMLDRTTASGPPRLLYEAQATAYPNLRSRNEDSTTQPPLRKSDLVHARDPACSYRRTFTLDPGADVFVPDTPLPDCSEYTVP